jgi:uncharacterized protein YndB with AHSA1/START domain
MGHIRENYHIDAPIERVWEIAHDCDRLIEWQTGATEVRGCEGRFDQVGMTYTFVYKAMGRTLDVRFETTKVARPKLLEAKLTAPGGGTGTSSLQLEPADGGTDMTYTFDYDLPGGFVGDLADKLFMERAIERDIRHSNENFKALCEAKVPAHT